MGVVNVQAVEPARTYRLRRDVLRPWMAVEDMSLLDPGGTDVGVFGAVDDETRDVVSTANVQREDAPRGLLDAVAPGERATWRLRGVATREELRGQGVGARVVGACLDFVGQHGGGLVWCNARVQARGFYERCGFVGWGAEFESIGIPHLVMWRTVEATRGAA